MTKIFIILLSFFCIPLVSKSQINIYGRIVDDKSTNIPYGGILKYSIDEKVFLGSAISDELGRFLITDKLNASVILIINSVGYKSDTLRLNHLRNDTALTIVMQGFSKQLLDVNVVAKKTIIERKIDRVIFNIENSLVSNIGDAMDAISKAPGVRVNDDGIQLIGKNAVRIMVNNRPIQLSGENLMNYLRSMSSSNLRSIEVITNPSARYEAEGNSGIINLVVKKDLTLGFNGMINTGLISASYQNTGLTGILNYNTKRLHFSSTMSTNLSESKSFASNNLESTLFIWDQYDENQSTRRGIRGELRIDYDISKNSSFGVRFSENYNSNEISSSSRGTFLTPPNKVDSVMTNVGFNSMPLSNRSIDLYMESKLDTLGKKLELSANYFNNSLDNGTSFINLTTTPTGSLIRKYVPVDFENNEGTSVFSAKADLILPYRFANLELGTKVVSIKSLNSLLYSEGTDFDLSNSNTFKYTENTQSLYVNASKTYLKWSFQLGFRLENTQTAGNSSTKDQVDRYSYTALFPTFFLKNTLSDNHSVTISYGRRVNRPDYAALNPARIYSVVNVYDQGNPFLKPSFSNNLELGYNFKDIFTTNIYASFLRDGFSLLTFLDANTNVQSNKYLNYSSTKQIGLSETISYSPKKWWESTNQVSVYLYNSQSNGVLLESQLKGLSSYLSTDNTFMINKKRTLMSNMVFWYQFPDQSNWFKNDDYYAVDINLRAAFLKRNLTFTAGVVDLFKTSQRYFYGTVNGINQFGTRYNDNRKFRLILMYKIGNSNLNKRARSVDDLESSRAKQ
ncbi:TonB-dependent receptor [Pedobacter sp. G11]|uniref:outer membrane beta-barrel family protein n=1 Tax=Pedobacter sp. G11 TaxID=2482728 RepID=UPI000F603B31|nr:outer membrane beta-barrel family protein [Pedobacter sp. G11]AZI24142.1 TonB-dependent receptor [Pedobacter sp. G11]